MRFQKICVVGLGYIGLPTAAIIASRKCNVIGLDVNPATVDAINRGESHIVEPDLDAVLKVAVEDGFLTASVEPEAADAFLIAVPTPFKDDHVPNLSYIEAASRMIAPVLKAGDLIILESTSPVGTTEKMSEWLAQERPDISFPQHEGDKSDVRVAHCPERVLPGQVLHELVHNNRVIGGMSDACSQAAKDLYAIFVEGECIVTDSKTAEMCKLTENSFRDVNIAFANELSVICEKLGIDVWELISLANLHPRVNILQPGPGVGGHCIAVDPWFIVNSAPEIAQLIRQARLTNDSKPLWVYDKILASTEVIRAAGKERPAVVCLGLAFKPDIDDLRESPALDICARVSRLPEIDLFAVEPYITELPDILAGKATLLSAVEAIEMADIVVLLVNHRAFRDISPASLSGKEIIDTRGFWRQNDFVGSDHVS